MTVRSERQNERRRRAAAEIAAGVAGSVQALRRASVREEDAGFMPDPSSEGIEVRPANAYEAVTRQMVETVQEDLREIKGRLNALVFAIVGGVAIDVIARVLDR
ncbi:MAG: hypothetical protein QM589_10285 [Thermomicrobiales bacterium]